MAEPASVEMRKGAAGGGFNLPAIATETSAMDRQLSPSDWFRRLCLVRPPAPGDAIDDDNDDDLALWPALKFDSVGELQDAVKSDVTALSADGLARLRLKIYRQGRGGGGGGGGGRGIAYLFGRGDVRRSLVPLTDGDSMVRDFFSKIDDVKRCGKHRGNVEFWRACDVVDRRCDEMASSDDESATVALSPGRDDVRGNVEDGGDSADSSHEAQRGGFREEEEEEVERGPINAGGSQKRKAAKRDGDEPSSGSVGGNKTPRNKARKKTPAVTPVEESFDPSSISPRGGFYRLLTDAQAWELLQAKFGLTFDSRKGHYLLPPGIKLIAKPIANSMERLRKELCAYGLPERTSALSREEEVNIARWVRYTHVAGLGDGEEVEPCYFGRPIVNFADAWGVMEKHFGCCHARAYAVPWSQSPWKQSDDVRIFGSEADVSRYFARYGVHCAPDLLSEAPLSEEDRFSLDIFFATPSIDILDTFQRCNTKGPRARGRNGRFNSKSNKH